MDDEEMTVGFTVLASDTLGDLPIILSNNDRSIIRNLIAFLLTNGVMEKEDVVEVIEFSNNFARQVLEANRAKN